MDSIRLAFFVGPGGAPLQEAAVRAVLSPEYNRRPLPELDIKNIDETWEKKAKELGPRLFNGSKFRLGAVSSPASAAENGVTLLLGITDYRDSLGTTTNVAAYQQHCGADVESHLAMALGVECLLVTKDEQCVLFRRSKHVATHAGWLCCPGGHPEPKNLCETHFGNNHAAAEYFAQHIGAARVVHELFDSAICEVVDEIGLERGTLTNNGLIAVVHSQLDLKPDLIFLVSTSLNADEVAAVHNKRLCAEAYESEEGSLMFVPLDGVRGSTDHVTPPSVACLLLGELAIRGSP
jgi:hypothetical protein